METEKTIPPKRFCSRCNRGFPLTEKYWYKKSSTPGDFSYECAECIDVATEDDLSDITWGDKIGHGVLRPKCVLWSPQCAVSSCPSDFNPDECWRLRGVL